MRAFEERGMQMIGKLPSVAFLLSGIFVAALGLNSFLLPNHFVDGGVTGVSIQQPLS